MRVGLFLFFAFGYFFLYSQEQKLDSLQKVIENYGAPDTTYVNLRMDFMKQKLFLTPSDSTWMDYATESLRISKELGYPKGQALSYEKIGVIYQYILSDPYQALDNYQKSIEIIENNKLDSNYAIGCYGNIGNILYEQGELRKALFNYHKALGHNEHNITALINVANIYGDLHMADSSLYFYKNAIEIAKKNQNHLYEAHGLSNMALVLHRDDKNEEALKHMSTSLELIDKYKLEFIRSNAYANASMVYLGNNDIENAEYYANEALNLKESLDNLFIQKTIWGTLSEVYEKKEEFENAFHAYKKYTTLNDSIQSEDRKLEISRKEIQYEADKKQALAQAEIERQKTIRNASLLGGGGLLFATMGGLILYKRRRDALYQKEKAEFQAKVTDTELKALRAQMNPHFIFNSLNSINSFIMKNDREEASDYLKKFAKLVRMTLENSEKKEIPLKDDLALLNTYFEIEGKRLPNKFDYAFHIDDYIDLDNTLVPPLILQPFIENSIWHGMSDKKTKGTIIIEVKKRGDSLLYIVDDDGVGRNSEAKTHANPHKSMGVQIATNRIEIINSSDQSKGNVHIIDKEEGLRVEVELPLTLAF